MTHASARATPMENQVLAVQALQFDDQFIGDHTTPSGVGGWVNNGSPTGIWQQTVSALKAQRGD